MLINQHSTYLIINNTFQRTTPNISYFAMFEQVRFIERLLLYFIALMLVSLMERNIRKQMVEKQIENLSILPARMKTKKPTWNNIRFFFRSIHLALIIEGEQLLQHRVKGVTKLHRLLLKLLLRKCPLFLYQIS